MRRPILLAAALHLALAVPAAAAPCEAAIQRFRAILDQDLRMGHVGKGVHAAATRELEPVAAACRAGRDAAALSALAAVKKRHGYPP